MSLSEGGMYSLISCRNSAPIHSLLVLQQLLGKQPTAQWNILWVTSSFLQPFVEWKQPQGRSIHCQIVNSSQRPRILLGNDIPDCVPVF
jgi:hypothetical protein